MSEAKFKAPKVVMEELNGLKDVYRSIIGLMDAIKYDRNESEVKSWIGFVYPNYQLKEQAVIDYVIWNKPTIELERERHYVVVIEESKNIYAKGDEIPLDVFIGSTCISYNYEDGWPKEEADKLNEFVNGKLVEVK